MKMRRVWHGYLEKYPADPDTALAKLLHWHRGYKPTATSAYPEPFNLIAASAWRTRPAIPDYKHAIIFKDESTDYWVIAIGTIDLAHADIHAWMMKEFSLGAVAVWTNDGALFPRPQPTYYAMDDEPGTNGSVSKDPVTLTQRLLDMDKYRVGELDLKQFYPEKFKLTEKHLVILADYKPDSQGNYPTRARTKPKNPKLPGQGSGNSRCVYTPMGVYPSIKLAAEANGMTMSKMYANISGSVQGYGYLSREEYLRQTTLNISEDTQSVASN